MLWLDDLFVLLLVVVLTSLSLIFHLFVANASTFNWWERLSLQRTLQQDEKKQFDRLDTAGLMQQVEARAHHMPTASDNCTFVLSEYSLPVCRSLWRIVEYVLSDFIDFWWVKISDSPEFGNDLRDVFDHAFNVLGERCIKVDWSPFIVKNVISNLNYLMRIYRLTEQEVSSHNRFFSDTPEAARHRLLKAELMRTYKLHVAVSNPQAYFRKISEAILSQLLRSSDYRSESARTLTREVATTFVFLPVMKFVDPYWLNVGLITFLKLQQKEKEKEKEVAAAAGINSEPNSATPAGMRPHKHKSASSNSHFPSNVPSTQANTASVLSPSHSRSNSPTRGGIFSAPVEGGKNLLADESDAFEQSAHSLSNSTTNPLLDEDGDEMDGDSTFQPPLNYIPHRKESLLTQKMKEWEGEKKIRHEKKGKKGPSSRHTAVHHEHHHHHHSSHNISSTEHHAAEFENNAVVTTPTNSIATPAAAIPSITPSTPMVYPTAFPSPLSSNWDVRIVGAGIRFDPKPFVMYQLLVKNDVDNLKWTIVKRYQKFEELHQKLKKAIPSFDAQLPKKTFFGNLDQSFIQNRKAELQTYLGQLLWNKNVQENVDMQQFLLPSAEDNKWLQNTQGGSASGSTSGMNTPTTSSSISSFFSKKKDTNPSMSPNNPPSAFSSNIAGVSDDIRTPPTGGQPHSYQPQHLHHHHSTSNLYSQSVMPADSSVLMPSASTMALNNPLLASLAEGNDADMFQSPNENGDSPSQYQMSRAKSSGVSGVLSDAATPASPAVKHRVYPSDDLLQSSPPHHKPGSTSTGGPSNSGLGSSLFSTNWEDKSLTDPLYLLVEEIFNLNGRGWMRRQATWVGKQLVKMTMDTLIKKQLNRQVESLLNEHTLTAQIDWVTELIWPNGKLFEPKPPVDEKEKAAVKEEALKLLIQSIPTALKTLMGKEHCVTAMEKCFQFIQMEPLIQHFAYSVLDSLVLELFPELTSVIGK